MREEIITDNTYSVSSEDNSKNLVLPSSIDNIQSKYFPNIWNQGALNSCTSFLTAYYTMTYMTALANYWSVKYINGNNIDFKIFSPKCHYTFVNNEKNGGVFA